MTARKIRNSWWVDFRAEGIRYRKRSPENSCAGARAYEAVLRGRLTRGLPLMPPPPEKRKTFTEFARVWFDTYVTTNNKPSEQKTKATTLRTHLVPWFGQMRIDAISTKDIESYKAAKLKKGLAPKTINNHVAVLRKCLHTAVDWDEITHVPKVTMLHTQPIERDSLTIEEGERLVAGASDPLWRTMILLALRTGMRFGELCGLHWTDIDMERQRLTIRYSIVDGIMGSPKNHQARTIPFPGSVKNAFLQLPRQHELVFCLPDGRPIPHTNATRAIERACKAAGLRRIGWHILRHSCASQLGMLRGTLLEAQRMLGHSTLAMTERYTHLVPNALHDAVEELDRAAAHGAQSY